MSCPRTIRYFLAAVLWLDAWTAVTVSGVMSLPILVLRLGFRRGLRGVEGNRPTQAWAEVTYASAGTISLALSWGLLGDKWLRFPAGSVYGLGRQHLWPFQGYFLAQQCDEYIPLCSNGGCVPGSRSTLPALLDRFRGCGRRYCGRASSAHAAERLGR